jgi:hypothetical protein
MQMARTPCAIAGPGQRRYGRYDKMLGLGGQGHAGNLSQSLHRPGLGDGSALNSTVV